MTFAENTLSMLASELLHPEHMSDEQLRRILKDRGMTDIDELGYWQLLELYDSLALPKPGRGMRTRIARFNEIKSSMGGFNSNSSVILFPAHLRIREKGLQHQQQQTGNTTLPTRTANAPVNAFMSEVQVSSSSVPCKRSRPLSKETHQNTKRQMITFP